MKRSDIENKSKEITEKYFTMLSEMSRIKTDIEPPPVKEPTGFFYIKIDEISRRWITDERPLWDIMTELFVGLSAISVPISVVFSSDSVKTNVFLGCHSEHIDILDGMLNGTFTQIRYSKNERGNTEIYTFEQKGVKGRFGGYLKGNPTGNCNFNTPFQIDSIIKGMAGNAWDISVFAQPVQKSKTVLRQQYWLAQATQCSELADISFTDNDNVEAVTYKKNYYHSEQYREKVEAFSERSAECVASGEWCVTVNFSAERKETCCLLGGLLTSAFYGEQSTPEPVHTVLFEGGEPEYIVDGFEYTHKAFCDIPYPKYSTLLSSRELAVYSALPTTDTSGFSVKDYVEFDVDRKIDGDLVIGNILDCEKVTKNPYKINTNEFNRHCLVTGLTGSGKTNTIKSLIYNLTKGAKRPIMVIEPAKKEYWELFKLGYTDLQIYSVGSSEKNACTLCLNPFECAAFVDSEGKKSTVSIQTHIDFVFAAFKASFIMYTPMPYVLEKAIYAIYEDCGWDIRSNTNKNGEEIYPTIEDLYYKIPQIVDDMGYDARMRNDLIGSLQARINSMRLGAKGDSLNVPRSFPMNILLEGNCVIELEDVGDDDVKAFIISILLVNLLEYRRMQDDCQLELRHLMLIEEAHRLLKNVQSGVGENADPRGAAVEFFCNLLAELRSKGQGFIVADQIPSKLAPDLIKNTNLKIVHRTVDEEERLLIGGAMHMTPEQIDSLASLKRGVAAVYSEGDERPKLVLSRYAGEYISQNAINLTRENVLLLTKSNNITAAGSSDYCSLTNRQNEICRHCDSHCKKDHRDILSNIDDKRCFFEFAKQLDPNRRKSCVVNTIKENISEFCKLHLRIHSENSSKDMSCIFNCLLDEWNLNKNLQNKLVKVYNKCKGE